MDIKTINKTTNFQGRSLIFLDLELTGLEVKVKPQFLKLADKSVLKSV